ncbi:methyltransferase-like protein 22 [Betta splendens]|uniref:Methyltransferase-like protein 22 n=1 Tax=Betta splendens TaxID=158456 RepID=A0A6P7N471_BETSP|nr:methyltransferase-like protein 22 [Betta splendens]XP_029014243.1 methyltransferase-like protein 22 [Betta splendens]XP_029014244.1 methyltransferase-like protein 22 [Betta splendens]XP_029014245.1 methyltransferase-like protein 22 [Betta splendens]
MDQMSFHHDTVLSDVHMLLPNTCHLMNRLNAVGQPVFTSKFKILSDGERLKKNSKEDEKKDVTVTERKDGEEAGGNVVTYLDEDGDLDVRHRPRKNPAEGIIRDLASPIILKQSSPILELDDESLDEANNCCKDIVRIEHTMATPLEDVGKQVWRGAFLLADFILSEPAMFRGATVLELGAGTGLTSIIMATLAKRVYCTDVGEDLLSMCKRNVMLNRHMMDTEGGEVRVRQLDWLQYDLCTDTDEFSWTQEEVADLYDNTNFIIAADVCYDDDLTDGLFRTLYRLCSNLNHSCTIFISLEKRMNFTLRHMDISCEAYDHFRQCLSQLNNLVDRQCSFSVEQLTCNFSQFLLYERIDQLELWKVTAEYNRSGQARSDSDQSSVNTTLPTV